jgi:integrase
MIYKRGKIYWYKFMWRGSLIRESTKQGNDKIARQMESAHRTSLARGEVGLRDKKPSPRFADFIVNRFEPWAKATFEKNSPKTWRDYYKVGIKTVLSFRRIAEARLDQITSETIAEFAANRQAQGLQITTVNSSLQIVRRMLRLAVEWGVLDSSPKIRMLSGGRHREHVVTFQEEAQYLAAAPELLGQVATVLIDSGMRPEECFRLRWESVSWSAGRHGTLLVTHGKTAAARRQLPLTLRVRAIFEKRRELLNNPHEGWIWPASTRSGHLESSSLKKQHARTFHVLAEKRDGGTHMRVRKFVLYSLRHTFLTRLGESGCDAWTLARIAGHSSVAMSSRYVHPSEDAVFTALERLGGHNIGHSSELTVVGHGLKKQLPS